MEPEQLLVLDGQDEIFQHSRLLIIRALLVQVNSTRTIGDLSKELRRSNKITVVIETGLSAAVLLEADCEIRLRFAFLPKHRRRVAGNCRTRSRIAEQLEQEAEFDAVFSMQPARRRRHVDDPSNQFNLCVAGILFVAPVELRL